MESLPSFSSPQEEIAYLRAQVAEREAALAQGGWGKGSEAERATIVREQIRAHHDAPTEVLAEPYRLNDATRESEAEAILKELALGGSEAAVRSLADTLEREGVKNALAVAEKAGDPHLVDDFHRYLVRYLAAGLPAVGLDERAPRFQALRMTLYEVALPEPSGAPEEREKTLKELISGMEQFYAGMLAVGEAAPGEPGYFALELAVPAESAELRFYAAVPEGKCGLFEKQLLAIFPHAHLSVQPRDYNPLVAGGTSLVSLARLAEPPALPLKDYAAFDYDPLNAVMNAFAKIERAGEGAALQIIVAPCGERHLAHYRKILDALRHGDRRGDALALPESMLGELAQGLGKTLFGGAPEKDEEKAREERAHRAEENRATVEAVEQKVAAPIADVTIRLAASSGDASVAERVLGDLEASFNQFANTAGNRFRFERLGPRQSAAALEDFSFRLPAARALPLSLRELTTLYHFPPQGVESSPHLKQSRFTHAPAPLGLPREGVLLGENAFRGATTDVRLAADDRLRHLYVVGQTGTGKSGFLQSLIIQDILNGEGCCYIDPHGNDILDVLAAVPPERYQDVIYFDPADVRRPFGLNFLEYDLARPEQKTFIVNELLMIFRSLYGDVPESMGPAFEQYFRNATQLVMEDPGSGSTILDIPRVLSSAEFRAAKLSRSMNPVVNQFWTEIASKAGGEAALENIVPYITNKFDDFTANDFIRPIVGQQQSSFGFRQVMDEKKILLVNLSKGRLGERNASLIGLILVGKLFMAALSRADNPRAAYPPFYLYIDEFQNVTTDSIPGILSEARKYRLALTVAHQFLAQVGEKTRNAVFGNVGNMAVFRVGEEDAEVFAKLFAPVFAASDFVNIENRNAYARLLAAGVPQKPFDFRTADLPAVNHDQVEDLIRLSSLTYGRDRSTVEAAIRERYLGRGA
jgi:hypothetical protein